MMTTSLNERTMGNRRFTTGIGSTISNSEPCRERIAAAGVVNPMIPIRTPLR